MMTLSSGIAYINDEYVPISEAKISILDFGFLHSDATYDVVHVWKGRFFRLDAHIERFLQSAKKLHLTIPIEKQELTQILAECTKRSGLEDAYVEMIITRGTSPTFSRDPREATNQLICFAIPFGWILPPEKRDDGLSVAISQIQRIQPESVDPRIKNYHWIDFILGLYDAYDRGASNVILQDGDGNLTEGPGFNIFTIKNNILATPNKGVLEGITRRSAMEIAREIGFQVAERPVSAAELSQADETFATSSAGGIIPITRVDGLAIKNGRSGPITKQLINSYWQKHTDPKWSVRVDDYLHG